MNMKKTVYLILIIFQFALASNTGIIPRPQEVEICDQVCHLSAKVDFILVGNPQNLEKGREIVTEALTEISPGRSDKNISIILEKIDGFKIDHVSKEQVSEAYSLEIAAEKILIQAGSDKGLFYGLMSVTQLVRASDDGTIPTLKILDYPDMSWRGISDDFSRGQVSTMENFETILRFLGEYKQNIYMPYMEDVVQFDQYPDIGVDRGALSKQDIAQLQKMAEQYFVQVIPIFQTLGHYENILSDPTFRKYAEFPGAASLNTIDEQTDTFLFNMLDELIPQFHSDYFHIGCDESRDVGFGASKELVKKNGTARVHADHYNKIYDKVTSQGKKVMMYGDIILRHPEILDMVPKDIIIVDWHYWPNTNYPSIKQFKEAGFTFLVSPGIHNWRQTIPNFTNAWMNISIINYEGYLNGALGSINSSWGDYGGLNFREMNYLGYAMGAESSWNPSNMDGNTIKQRFLKQYFGSDCLAMESLFIVSNEIPNNTDLRYIFSNPFLPNNNDRNSSLSSTRLIQNGELTLKLINQLRQKNMRNVDKLDYYEIGARIGIMTGKKIALRQRIDFYTENAYNDMITTEILQEFIDECNILIAEILEIEHRYRELWIRTNRVDNLDRLMNIFQQQVAYIKQAKQSLEKGIVDIDQEIPSKWISAKVHKEGKNIAPSFLRKEFKIEDPDIISSAYLQVVANDAAEVYLNGQNVGLVAAAKSGSLMAEKRRVGYWDVSKLLQKGDNTIAIEVQAYKPGRPSCANIYLEYTAAEDKTIIVSDQSWEATSWVSKNWQIGKDKRSKWKNALIYEDFPKQISIPLFEEGFPSQMEL